MAKLKFNGIVTEVYTTPEKEKVNSIETGANKTEFATTSEATTATNNTKAMTPLRTKEAILALSPPPDLSGYATTIALDGKVDKVTGMGLSTNDYTDVEKAKLDGKQDKLTAGTNVTISGNTISATDTTYGLATASDNGLMTSTDKVKMDNIEVSGIRVYASTDTIPTLPNGVVALIYEV